MTLLAVLAAVAGTLLAAVPAQAARTLGEGARGSQVTAVQRLLARAGFATRPDGVFGPGTARAVRRFEAALELRVDGRVTRADLRRLRAAVALTGTGGLGAHTLPAREAHAAETSEPAEAAPAPVTTEAPGAKAQLTEDGLAVAPASAPPAVKRVIAAANEIARTPYRYGGGHGRWRDTGYDCSGSVSYALHGGGLLERSMPSGSFTTWGRAGAGRWITIYANGGHMYMTVAGLRFDTSGRAQTGSRWQRAMRSPAGYTVRHPAGL
jgi:peptidoglycan hydrolase-like protein with peptidoglycan-binding domain